MIPLVRLLSIITPIVGLVGFFLVASLTGNPNDLNIWGLLGLIVSVSLLFGGMGWMVHSLEREKKDRRLSSACNDLTTRIRSALLFPQPAPKDTQLIRTRESVHLRLPDDGPMPAPEVAEGCFGALCFLGAMLAVH